jgi:hypothetical protein
MSRRRVSAVQKISIVERIKGLTNAALVQETIGAASGDDYDGGFTDWGSFEFEQLKVELQWRLRRAKFIEDGVEL